MIELQLEAINADQKGVANGVATLGADGKVPASQLNVSAPPDATTTQKGVVQLSNSTTSTSEILAATPKAVKDAKDGLSAQIGILSGLNTTAKDNLVNAVNELFTFANDGKTKWSSVIGSPLASSDTFTQMQTKTQTIKNTLATNLTNKGQSSTGTETLTALANKVANVSTGKKVASGSGWSSSNTVTNITGTDGSSYYFEVSGLDFQPDLVLIWNSSGYLTVAKRSSSLYSSYKVLVLDNALNPGKSSFYLSGDFYMNYGGFRVAARANKSYYWIAYE
ncbi:MAG: tail fiber protein [Exiguobacterium sp.]|nr:tail fiber protein [Exiguobacterium sp.]MBR3218165.1 tail fiber protein [Exiguobacterium sp.]